MILAIPHTCNSMLHSVALCRDGREIRVILKALFLLFLLFLLFFYSFILFPLKRGEGGSQCRARECGKDLDLNDTLDNVSRFAVDI